MVAASSGRTEARRCGGLANGRIRHECARRRSWPGSTPGSDGYRSTSMTVTEQPLTTDEQRVTDLVEHLIESPSSPATTSASGFSRCPVRSRPGVDPLRRGLRRPRTQSEAAAHRHRSRASAPRAVPRVATAIRSATACVAPPSTCGEARSRSSATCARCSRVRRSGASCSPSRVRVPTSPVCRRSGIRDGDEWVVNGQKVWTTLGARVEVGICSWCAPIRRRSSTPVSRPSSSTWRPRRSRPARCAR